MSIFNEHNVFVDRYDHGGISSGQIDVESWRNKYIPMLIRNFIKVSEC